MPINRNFMFMNSAYVLLPQPNVVQWKIFDWAALLVHKWILSPKTVRFHAEGQPQSPNLCTEYTCIPTFTLQQSHYRPNTLPPFRIKRSWSTQTTMKNLYQRLTVYCRLLLLYPLSGELCIVRLYTERRKTHAERGRTGGHIGYREGGEG